MWVCNNRTKPSQKLGFTFYKPAWFSALYEAIIGVVDVASALKFNYHPAPASLQLVINLQKFSAYQTQRQATLPQASRLVALRQVASMPRQGLEWIPVASGVSAQAEPNACVV